MNPKAARLVIITALVGVVLVGCGSSDTSSSPKPSRIAYATPNPSNGRIDIGTFTPPSPTPTDTPKATKTPGPSATATPTPSGEPNFSSAFIDWEDVGVSISTNLQLCPYARAGGGTIPYCTWQCPTLTSSCNDELERVIHNEVGTFTPGSTSFSPGSNVALCLNDPSCKISGYSHYSQSSSHPLNAYAPDQQCQDQIRTCFEQSPIIHTLSHQWFCNDPYNGECDLTDGICGYQDQTAQCHRY